MTVQTTNPATGQMIQIYQEMEFPEVSRLIQSTQAAFLQWREQSFSERAKITRNLGNLLLKNKQQYAELITQEMGKPINLALAEIQKCQKVCEFYAEKAAEFLAPKEVKTDKSKSYVAYQPLGIIFAIMPWNFPFWQVFRFATPNLIAGNAALLRHAPITTGAGLAIEKLCQEAGFPENLFRTLVISNEVAAQVIQHPLVKGVTLTGSPGAGSIVGAEAVKSLKKVVLELGGSDPYLVLADADLKLAAKICVAPD